MYFRNRREAGRALARELLAYSGRKDVLVLALPRGGVPVGFEVARALGTSLDVFVVRKLGVPGHEELAMGAVASGGVCVLNDVVEYAEVPAEMVERVTARERAELERRERLYRDDRPFPEVVEKTIVLVDDGLATGATMLAAVRALSEQHPARIVVAVPVASRQAVADLLREGVDCVAVALPEPFFGVGMWYADFSQISDEEVRVLLELANAGAAASKH
jgi:predicted phosphoribosyltransferase